MESIDSSGDDRTIQNLTNNLSTISALLDDPQAHGLSGEVTEYGCLLKSF